MGGEADDVAPADATCWGEQHLCIMPCTEEAYKEEPLNPYNGAAIHGVGASFVEKIPRLSKDPHYVSR